MATTKMDLTAFEKATLGKPIDFDHALGYQCMDLIEQYNQDVIHAPRLGGDAINLLNNPRSGFYDYYPNGLTYVPPRGAIAIWGNNVGGGKGHCAIVLSANLLTFVSLDQNWPNSTLVHEQSHNYLSPKVVGFLVPKLQTVQPTDIEQQLAAYKSKVNQAVNDITSILNTLR